MKVYLKILCITAVAMLASCATMDRVSKTDAERVLHEFFRNVDFEVYNRESFRDLITDDFHIYEAGQHMSRNDFFDLSKVHIRKRRSQTIGSFQILKSPPTIVPPISATKTWGHSFQKQRMKKNLSSNFTGWRMPTS